jgi:hypothetical protein
MNSADEWIIANASVIGPGHQKTNTPCQDASVIQVGESGEWVAVVVSDGAGTASHSQEGSSFIAGFFATSLISLSVELASRAPGQWINDYVIERILEARHSLRAKAASDDISKYHCTLVACLLGPSGGFAIHIGDGAIFGGNAAHQQLTGETQLNSNFFISAPDNGEYTNETYFVTEGNWIKNLRITPMPKLDWIYACTDGGTALSMIADKEPKEGFIVPVLNEILKKNSTAERNTVLTSILADPQADKVTGDDKTIAIACRTDLKMSARILRFQGLSQNIPEKINQVTEKSNPEPKEPPPQLSNSINRRRATPIRALAYGLCAFAAVIAIVTAIALLKPDYLSAFEISWLKRLPTDTTIPSSSAQPLPKSKEVGGNTSNLAVPRSESPSTRNVEKPVTDGAGRLDETNPPMQPTAVSARGSNDEKAIK